MSLVLDASVTIAWAFEEAHTPPVLALLGRVTAEGAEVPGLWPLEVLNVLALALARRRDRLPKERMEVITSQIQGLPIAVDAETPAQAWNATLALAERHGLTVHDACYLELALRRGLPLASFDERLRAAAEAAGVACLGR